MEIEEYITGKRRNFSFQQVAAVFSTDFAAIDSCPCTILRNEILVSGKNENDKELEEKE